jgi:hypothetical protein
MEALGFKVREEAVLQERSASEAPPQTVERLPLEALEGSKGRW